MKRSRTAHFRIPFVIAVTVLAGAIVGCSSEADEEIWTVGTLWKVDDPRFTEKGSRHFESNGPMLRSIRVSKRGLAAGETCESAIERAKKHPIGAPFDWKNGDRWKGWYPWDDDIDAVENCSEFPCKIKFNEPETVAIAAKPKKGRLEEVQRQIENRMKGYEKNSRRRGYDLPEDAIDPWKIFVERGHEMPKGFEKTKPKFFLRKLRFGEGSYRPVRQVFDERTFEEKNRLVRIARDVYTAHYFDGWGEWLEVRCFPEKKEIHLLQDILMEFDLLKNTDFFSVIARPKMRMAVDQESLKYQKTQARKLFAR